MKFLLSTSILMLFGCIYVSPASAQIPGISYPVRTHPYAGWSGIIKGDNNTIGMAGATVAMPSSIASMEYNPAGLAMHVGGLAAQINAFTNREPSLNHGNSNYQDYEWGLGTSIPPWGFGVTYYSPSTEHSDTSEVSVRQVRVAAARMFGDDLSVGLAIGFDKGIRKFSGQDLSGTHMSAQIGALYRLKDHWVLGGSYTPGLTIGPTSNPLDPALISFNRDIQFPHVIALGLGFIPNRYFKAGFSILGVTGTENATLLIDQNVQNGAHFTAQPRLGASYILAEWSSLKIELAAGTYYEMSRVEGLPNRTHGTFGLDINPWFINTGIGADIAKSYVNWNISVGLDIVRTFRTFKTIPPDPVPFYEGVFPPIFEINADGLADGFTKGEEKSVSPPSANDVKNIVEDFPQKLNEKFGGTLPEAPKVETPKQSKKVRKNKKKSKSPQGAKPPAPALKALAPTTGGNNP